MDEREKKYCDFLLADFNAIKSEIPRRSNLQRAVVAAMLAFYAWLYQHTNSNNPLQISIIVITWLVSFLGYTFIIRERAEIRRLGWNIKNKIAGPASKILGQPPEEIIPSQSHTKRPGKNTWKKIIGVIFEIAIYLIPPVYLTIVYILTQNGRGNS